MDDELPQSVERLIDASVDYPAAQSYPAHALLIRFRKQVRDQRLSGSFHRPAAIILNGIEMGQAMRKQQARYL